MSDYEGAEHPDNQWICSCGHRALDHGSEGRCYHTTKGNRCRCDQFVRMPDSEWLEKLEPAEIQKALDDVGFYAVNHGGKVYTISRKKYPLALRWNGWTVTAYIFGKKWGSLCLHNPK